ncbi:MAG: Sec-independent protein translocase subunit TatA [Actinomycetaceae bacterium]|nr:Sec-independent protein translocase subunit TatA [Actinomycetaceae bacterium]
MKPQLWHIIVLVIVIVLIFGTAKLPDIARSIGQSAKIFKKEMKELTEDDSSEASETVKKTSHEDSASSSKDERKEKEE